MFRHIYWVSNPSTSMTVYLSATPCFIATGEMGKLVFIAPNEDLHEALLDPFRKGDLVLISWKTEPFPEDNPTPPYYPTTAAEIAALLRDKIV